MSVTSREERLLSSVYARLGHEAQWTGIADPVRVILRDRDAQFGEAISDNVTIRVRRSQVSDPASGDSVQLTDGRGYTIIGTPLLDRKQEWDCEARPT